jgi:hypothetical protein
MIQSAHSAYLILSIPILFIFTHSFLNNIHEVLVTRFNQSISLWVIIRRMRQQNSILGEKNCQSQRTKILCIISSDFGWGTKSCDYSIFKETHYNFFSCLLCWYGLYPPSEIVCSSQNPSISITRIVFKFTNKIQTPLLKRCLNYQLVSKVKREIVVSLRRTGMVDKTLHNDECQ